MDSAERSALAAGLSPEDFNFAWCRLSAAYHHDAYELPPSLDELEHLADIVDSLAAVGV